MLCRDETPVFLGARFDAALMFYLPISAVKHTYLELKSYENI